MREKTVEQFMSELASKAPVPGGGGAAAIAGALGTALSSMVANLTTGKKKYAAYQEDIDRILERSEQLWNRFLELMEEDARVFEPLSKAYGLPKSTPEETAYRENVMEEALLAASLTPLAMMETVAEAVALHEELAVKGSVLAVSDVGVGVKLLEAALHGASLNVYINTRLMKNREKAEELNARTEELISRCEERCHRVFEEVRGKLIN